MRSNNKNTFKIFPFYKENIIKKNKKLAILNFYQSYHFLKNLKILLLDVF